MGISKTLLYPFTVNSPYYEGYAWAVELAQRLNAKLQLFTAVESADETTTEDIYQSLLAAHGYYLHHFRHDNSKPDRIIREQYISTGEFQNELKKHLKGNPVDIMIIDPVFQSLHTKDLKEIIRESGGAIILTGSPALTLDDPLSSEEIVSLLLDGIRNLPPTQPSSVRPPSARPPSARPPSARKDRTT